MLQTVRDLVHLRWRVAQLMSALVDGDGKAARAAREAMRVEGINDRDMVDEFRLLLGQFGRRAPVHLRDEIGKLWRQLTQFCVRCGRTGRYRDNADVCYRCIIEESS